MNLQEDAKEQSVSHSTQTWRLAASFLKRHFQHKKVKLPRRAAHVDSCKLSQ